MSVPELTAEEVAYYASLQLADPDEATLAAFIAQPPHRSGVGCSSATLAVTPTSARASPPALSTDDEVDDVTACRQRRRRSSSSSPPSRRSSSTTGAMPQMQTRWQRLLLASEGHLASSPPTAQVGVTHILDRDERVGGVAGMAEAALQTRCVDLSARRLTSTASVQCFLNATHVYLQHNGLTTLDGIELLSQLQVLAVQHNRLTSLAALRELDHLFYLDARDNCVQTPVSALLRDQLPCGSLASLSLSGNPCCDDLPVADGDTRERHRAYAQMVREVCPLLEQLEGVSVSDEHGTGGCSTHSSSSSSSSSSGGGEDRVVAESAQSRASARRARGAVEWARAAAASRDRSRAPSSGGPDGGGGSDGAPLAGLPRQSSANRGTGGGVALVEEEEARLAHQLLLRRGAETATEPATAPTRAAASELSAAPLSHALLDGRRDSLQQLYQNLQYTQEVGQARQQRDMAAHWDDVSRVLQTAQALQHDRRRRLQQRLLEQTPAYAEALRQLEAESYTKDLNRYRSGHAGADARAVHTSGVDTPATLAATARPAREAKEAKSTRSSVAKHLPTPPPPRRRR
ncbi:hypothetical protein NESM_000605800 [Novymonas esmeraldas]|uniref:Uncharacterized protein n=1 Tax=Novymonas esmeraldas TaxID=1808958 RepID=A0AAW0ER89_9TRYP